MGIFKRLRKQIAVVSLILFFMNMAQAADGDYSWTKLQDSLANKSVTWQSIASSSDGKKLAAVVSNGGYIYTSTDYGTTWTERTSAGARDWRYIVSSSDGTKLAATVIGGKIYTSTNSGVTWTEQANSTGGYVLACSSDGTKLVTGSGYIYTSTDSGVTWTKQTSAGNTSTWYGFTISDDGTKMVGVAYGGYIYRSTDSGVNWNFVSGTGNLNWRGVTGSRDGHYLAATYSLGTSGYIYTSTDYGATWEIKTSAGNKGWISIASSNDGSKVVAVSYSGVLSTSDDYGNNWVTQTNLGSGKYWQGVASSGDGSRIAAIVSNGNIIYTSSDYGVNWSENSTPGNRAWSDIDISGDGTKLIAGVGGGYVYTSTDSGTSWTEHTSPGNKNWRSVSISNDGTKMAVATYYGYICISTDSGSTWLQQTSLGYKGWQDLTSSSDGLKLFAVSESDYIYASTDAGITWLQKTSDTPREWRSITSSSDGTKLAAVVYGGGYIYTSTDSGNTWQQSGAPAKYWNSISSSSDGKKLAATIYSGSIYTSTDYGSTWTLQSNAGTTYWSSIASSGDGNKLIAANKHLSSNSFLYLSTDSGSTWTTQTTAGSKFWSGVASSTDGSKIAACAFNGGIISGTTASASNATSITYAFSNESDEVTYTASKSGTAFATITMSESKIGIGTLAAANFSDVEINISAEGKPTLIIPDTNSIAVTVNADLGTTAVVTASFTGLPAQADGKVPAIMMNGTQISDSNGNVFSGYTNYVRNISWNNTTGTLTFEILHFTEYGVPVLIGKTFAGTAASTALNANGSNIVVSYSSGSITGTVTQNRTVTVQKISGLAYETVLSDVPGTANNLYRPMVPGVTYNISFEYINRGNASDQVDLTTAIEKTNVGHFTVGGNQSKTVAAWQVASFNVEIDADNAYAYERATVDITIDLNGVNAVSYNAFTDAYQGGTFASDGQYGGVADLSHRFVLEAEGYSLTILNRSVTVNAPAAYNGTPVSETNLVPGAMITYFVAVKNNNNSVATSINLSDVIPNNCHLYYTTTPNVEGTTRWNWQGATSNAATNATNDAVKFEITIPALSTVTASYTVTLD